MKICGPKYALCGLVLSVWGIIQLLFMGVFFYVRSVALVEDLPLEGKVFETKDEFYTEADRGYTQNAYNCWIAACIYVLTFLFSGHQFYVNSRSSLSV
ncbi:ribonuclease kappa-B [Orussus abietinus]|uniref:ribonuclease kappa-B n=1 Tax=Orussus abietinus TaxID=222816 RepID=UPI000625E0DA|nr:ribonuclease kappa-B [Orussus abietinus]XP_012277629.1 ribonuclease kappa-B [Orussus abietinus]XP_012277630.1 ribonuclease kappa-B [Orussus abietinus]